GLKRIGVVGKVDVRDVRPPVVDGQQGVVLERRLHHPIDAEEAQAQDDDQDGVPADLRGATSCAIHGSLPLWGPIGPSPIYIPTTTRRTRHSSAHSACSDW